jgi:aryl-phospho-beta-D-glucosidase BglC (GH1 family)
MHSGINYTINPELINKRSLEVLAYLINRCKNKSLYVILDRQRPSKDGQSELWYTSQVDELTGSTTGDL